MSTNVLPALIKPPALPSGLSIGNVVSGTNPGGQKPLSLTLAAPSSGRLLAVFVSNEDGFFSGKYSSSLEIGSGNFATEETAARARATRLFADEFSNQFYWLAEDTLSGATDFTVNMTPDQYQIICFEIYGADNAAPVGAVQADTSTSSNCEFTLTTTVADSLALSGSHGRATPFTAAAGLTENINFAPTSNFFAAAANRNCPTIGGYTMGGSATGTVTCASSAVEILTA